MFDFAKDKVEFLKVKLLNGDVVHIKNPTKKQMKIIAEAIKVSDNLDSSNIEDIDKIYEIFFEVMSWTKDGETVAKGELENYTVGDIRRFLRSYIAMVYNNIADPN